MKFSAASQSLSRWAGSPRTFYEAVAWSLSGNLNSSCGHFSDDAQPSKTDLNHA